MGARFDRHPDGARGEEFRTASNGGPVTFAAADRHVGGEGPGPHGESSPVSARNASSRPIAVISMSCAAG